MLVCFTLIVINIINNSIIIIDDMALNNCIVTVVAIFHNTRSGHNLDQISGYATTTTITVANLLS